jgi:hypothetical protein
MRGERDQWISGQWNEGGGMIKHAEPSESSEDAFERRDASPYPSLSPTRRERLLQNYSPGLRSHADAE